MVIAKSPGARLCYTRVPSHGPPPAARRNRAPADPCREQRDSRTRLAACTPDLRNRRATALRPYSRRSYGRSGVRIDRRPSRPTAGVRQAPKLVEQAQSSQNGKQKARFIGGRKLPVKFANSHDNPSLLSQTQLPNQRELAAGRGRAAKPNYRSRRGR